jgi:defect-in-organelle-trafficking protein DotB
MRFTDEVRDKLMDMDFKDWPAEIQRMLPFYGQTMAKSAELLFEKGDIDRRTYIMLSNSTGGGGGD